MSKWRFTNQRLKTFSLGAILNGVETEKDEIVQNERLSKANYNVETGGGAIKTLPLFSTYPIISEFRVRTITDFLDENDKLCVVLVDANGNLIKYDVGMNSYVNASTKQIIANGVFSDTPSIIKYRLNGKNVLIFASKNKNLTVFDGENPPTEYENAPKVRSMAVHSERLFVTRWDDSLSVWFSDDLDPTNWDLSLTGAGFIELSGDLGRVNKVISFAGYVYAFREFGITRIFADGNQQDFSVTNLHTCSGSIYAETVTVCGDRIMFCSQDGVYSFDGYNCTKRIGEKGEIMMVNDNSTACYWQGKYYFTCTFEPMAMDEEFVGCEGEYGDGFVNNAMVVYDVNNGKYVIYRGIDVQKLCPMPYAKRMLFIENGTTYYTTKTHGGLMGYEFLAKWYMPRSVLGYPDRKKTIKSLSFYHEGDLSITVYIDDKEYEYHIKGDLSKRTFSKIAINKRGFVIGMNVKINSVGAGISIPTFTFY